MDLHSRRILLVEFLRHVVDGIDHETPRGEAKTYSMTDLGKGDEVELQGTSASGRKNEDFGHQNFPRSLISQKRFGFSSHGGGYKKCGEHAGASVSLSRPFRIVRS
jgi:hypothetical protein